MQKIYPCFWFDGQAEEAANFHVSIFKNSKIVNIARYDEASAKASGQPKGSVITVTFQLDGQDFIVRLAERSLWFVMADRSDSFGRADKRPRPGETATRDGGGVANEETGYRGIEAREQRRMKNIGAKHFFAVQKNASPF